jgi:predicted Zn finger-like uncharacterized protein
MILTCPECATSYFVDDSRIPAHGRRVKCTSCSHRWMAGPDGPIPELPSYEPEPEPEPLEVAADAVALDDDIAAVPVEAEAAPPIRRPSPASRNAGRSDGRSSILVWAGAAALAAALVAGAVVFREQMVRVWPRSAAAYAGLGLEVAGGGLVLEQVQVQPAFLAGRPVLSVSGAIRNMRDVPVNAPPVRLTLLNRAGQPVAAKIARPDEAAIPARARRRFTVTMIDPPATARDLEVRFDNAPRGKPAPRAAEAVLTPTPRLPQPVSKPAETAPAAPGELSPAVATEHG